ncbi:MAG: hypothetical protein QW118_06905 [Nitrososphaerota archaeon]
MRYRKFEQAVKVSVSEIVESILGESYAPREILEENRLIHHRLGFEGSEEFSVMVGGLEAYGPESPNSLRSHGPIFDTPIMLTFKPDTFRDDIIYELKILRPYSDRDRLITFGVLQLQLELYALGLEHGRLLVYRYSDKVLEEYDVKLDQSLAEKMLAYYIQSLKLRGQMIDHLKKSIPNIVKPRDHREVEMVVKD